MLKLITYPVWSPVRAAMNDCSKLGVGGSITTGADSCNLSADPQWRLSFLCKLWCQYCDLPGCSLLCEHIFENAITPLFRYEIIWIFCMSLIDVLSMTVFYNLFQKKLLFLAKKDKSVNALCKFLPISARPQWIWKFLCWILLRKSFKKP